MELIATSGVTQDKILYQIKRRGPQTVKVLSDALGVTSMGIRQHLTQLEAEGLVTPVRMSGPAADIASSTDTSSPTKGKRGRGRGRPALSWKLTGDGHGRFPDAHAHISSELIDSVRELFGETGLQQLIDKRTRDSRAQYLTETGNISNLGSRVARLAQLRSAEGYMAEVEALGDGGFRLLEHHCPICVAARSCQGFCASELDVFESVFEGIATVRREDHLLQGARRCSYLIRPG